MVEYKPELPTNISSWIQLLWKKSLPLKKKDSFKRLINLRCKQYLCSVFYLSFRKLEELPFRVVHWHVRNTRKNLITFLIVNYTSLKIYLQTKDVIKRKLCFGQNTLQETHFQRLVLIWAWRHVKLAESLILSIQKSYYCFVQLETWKMQEKAKNIVLYNLQWGYQSFFHRVQALHCVLWLGRA